MCPTDPATTLGNRPPARRAFPLIAALSAALCMLLSTAPAPARDAGPGKAGSVDELVDRVTEGLGGAEAWEATRYLVFEFAGVRRHWWDRYTGRHRLEGTTEEGEHYVVLHDVHDAGESGRAWVSGEAVVSDRADELVRSAYAAWVNDSFWLISPFKLRDPGVRLERAGEETVDGVTYDKLHLSFENVGLTPGDQYWMYVHPETGRVERWAYVLESQEPPPTVWEWLDWERYGPGILLSSRRVREGDGRTLTLGPIAAPAELPDWVFASPLPVEPIERPIEGDGTTESNE
jgi:hypothetical protein